MQRNFQDFLNFSRVIKDVCGLVLWWWKTTPFLFDQRFNCTLTAESGSNRLTRLETIYNARFPTIPLTHSVTWSDVNLEAASSILDRDSFRTLFSYIVHFSSPVAGLIAVLFSRHMHIGSRSMVAVTCTRFKIIFGGKVQLNRFRRISPNFTNN